ncbi:MAG TPA: tetratricopeptide repeat protein, partial [Pyrinomonadaceae bacterium]|nr:tetratricopeptide repeat protein [Pyrinomonadaceae bacterium]
MSNTSTLNVRVWSLMLAGVLLATATAASSSVCAQSRGRSRTRQTRAPEQSPPAQTGAAYDQAVKLGDEARLAGRLDEAIAQYVKALKIQPKWTDGWWYIGAIFYEQDRYPEARDAFRNVVALDPNRGPAWGMLGLCEFQTHEYERAGNSLVRGRSLGFGGNQELESVVRYHAALLYIRFDQFEIAYDILTEF